MIRLLQNSAPGDDGVPPQLLKHGGEAAVDWIHWIISLVWRRGVAPTAWKRSAMVALFKKGSRQQGNNYRGITLLNTAGKVYALLLLHRVRAYLNSRMLDAQFGFRPGRGTGDATFCMRRIVELSREFDTPLWAALIDLRKAFDAINRDVLWQILEGHGVHSKLVQLIKDLYDGSAARVSMHGGTSAWFPLHTGVRQGCPMSPTLFNTFMDFLMRQVIAACAQRGVHGITVGIRRNGSIIPQPAEGTLNLLLLLYADDLVLLAPTASSMHTALMEMERIVRMWGMAVNYDKSIVLHVHKQQHPQQHSPPQPAQTGAQQRHTQTEPQHQPAAQPAAQPLHFHLQHGTVAVAANAMHLGVLLQSDGGQDQEFSRRMTRAGATFAQLQRGVFSHRGVQLSTKCRLYKTIVMTQLLYSAPHTWAPSQQQLHHFNVWHNSNLRRMLGVRLGPNTASIDSLHSRAHTADVSQIVLQRRISWLGHVGRMPDHRLVKLLLAATHITGAHRPRGAPHASWTRVVQHDLDALGVGSSWYDECRLAPVAWKQRVHSLLPSGT
jgi:hypothetical protein